MSKAAQFCFGSFGVLLLVLAYQIGATSAVAQSSLNSTALDQVIARRVTIVDADGDVRAELRMMGGQPSLALFDSKQHLRAALALNEDGFPMLGLSDGDGTSRAVLATSGDAPALTLTDGSGTARAQISVTKGVPVVAAMDARGVMLAAMGVSEKSKGHEVGSFVVFNGNQDVLWFAPK